MKSKSVNVALVLSSLFAGAVAWWIGTMVYDGFALSLPKPFLIGIVFAVLYGITAIVVMLVSMCGRIFRHDLLFSRSWKYAVGGVVLGIVIMLVLGALFQWIYGLGRDNRNMDPTSYIFVIDDSGSNTTTDPENLRFGAISDIVSSYDNEFPYMIYSFADNAVCIRKMAPVSAGVDAFNGSSAGQTNIKGALQEVINDYQQGLYDGGACPRVILLSDGVASDITGFWQIRGVLQSFAEAGISISTVGYGEADQGLLTRIATFTGGINVNVEEILQLADGMAIAAKESTARDLLTIRNVQDSTLYAVLRIVFLAILGGFLGGMMIVAYGYDPSVEITAAFAGITAVMGALVQEFCVQYMIMPERIVWLVSWLLFSVTIAILPRDNYALSTEISISPDYKGVGGEERNMSATAGGYCAHRIVERPKWGLRAIVAVITMIGAMIIVLAVGALYASLNTGKEGEKNGDADNIEYAISRYVNSEKTEGTDLPLPYQYSNTVLNEISFEVLQQDENNNMAIVRFSYVDVMALVSDFEAEGEDADAFYQYCINAVKTGSAIMRTETINVEYFERTINGEKRLEIVDSLALTDVLTGGTASMYYEWIGEQ